MSGTDFQKLLFLLNQRLAESQYQFVPYNFGCFSFQSYADKRTLTKYNVLRDTEGWELTTGNANYLAQLHSDDQAALEDLSASLGSLRGKKLVRHVYLAYPYYATRSQIAETCLTPAELEQVASLKPMERGTRLFTLGYEGRSIDEYLNILVQHNVRVLCDVRRNPLSMKYGFSKKQLSGLLDRLGIAYLHFSSLGIASEARRQAHGSGDYAALFKDYTRQLEQASTPLAPIIDALAGYGRAALTCFERDANDCHRRRITDLLIGSAGMPVTEVTHL